jgi:hypothetical protein
MLREKKARKGSSEAPPTKCIALHVSVKEIIPNRKLISTSLFLFFLSQKQVYLPVLWIRIGLTADLDPAFLVNADPDADLNPYPAFDD